PGNKAAVKMHRCSVIAIGLAFFARHWVDHHRIAIETICFQWSPACSHEARVHGEEEVTVRRKIIGEFDPNRDVFFSNNQWSQIMELIYSWVRSIRLTIAIKSCWRQI